MSKTPKTVRVEWVGELVVTQRNVTSHWSWICGCQGGGSGASAWERLCEGHANGTYAPQGLEAKIMEADERERRKRK